MMPMDNHMMNKLESMHAFGVFCGCRGSAHETQIV